MQRTVHASARRGLIAFIAAASALIANGALAVSAAAGTPARVALPDPNLRAGSPGGTASPANPQLTMALRVYLSGRDPQGEAAAALAVSDPRDPGYARYLPPAQYEQRFGPGPAQVSAVRDWLTSAGMTITAANQHYITVTATVAQVDATLDTQITAYTTTFTLPTGQTKTLVTYGAAGGFSVPAALGGDVTTVTGFDEFTETNASSASPADIAAPASVGQARPSAKLAGAASGYQCSHYWGQHTVAIPAAYGNTSAPTQLCGYTVSQMRSAYGITSSPYTGKGATIAVVLDDASPTMRADANQFFAGQGVPGFAPGQYTEDFGGDDEPASALQASCSNETPDQPEETLDVETAHIVAPDAHVVYMGTNCDGDLQQNFLDTMTNVVDRHLADVVTDSYTITEGEFSPADVAAWSLTLEQGALEGIGFNFDSGDGGNYGDGVGNAQFPASDPWATAVGGTSLEIGANGAPVAQYGWGDGFTQENPAGTGYLEPLPDGGSDGSQGGLSTFFTQPAYQKGVVAVTLATAGGTRPGRARGARHRRRRGQSLADRVHRGDHPRGLRAGRDGRRHQRRLPHRGRAGGGRQAGQRPRGRLRQPGHLPAPRHTRHPRHPPRQPQRPPDPARSDTGRPPVRGQLPDRPRPRRRGRTGLRRRHRRRRGHPGVHHLVRSRSLR